MCAATYPLLYRALQDFRAIYIGQKSLYAVMNPTTGAMLDALTDNVKYKPIKKSEYNFMENRTLPLIQAVYAERFKELGLTDDKTKNDLVKPSAFLRIALLHQKFLTSQVFPTPEDQRLATHYGYYIDRDNLQDLWSELPNAAACAEMTRPTTSKGRVYSAKFRKLRVSYVDAALLAIFILCNETENRDCMTPAMERIRDGILSEYHKYCVARHGTEAGPVRMARIIALLQDEATFHLNYVDLCSMARLFVDEPEHWPKLPAPTD